MEIQLDSSDIECVFETGTKPKAMSGIRDEVITVNDDSDLDFPPAADHLNQMQRSSATSHVNVYENSSQAQEEWELLFEAGSQSPQIDDSFSLVNPADVALFLEDDPDVTIASRNEPYTSPENASGRRSTSSDIVCIDQSPPRLHAASEVADLSFSACTITTPCRSRKRPSHCLATPQTPSGSQVIPRVKVADRVPGEVLIGSRSATKNLKKVKKPLLDGLPAKQPATTVLDDKEGKKLEKEAKKLGKEQLAEKKRLEKEEKDKQRKAVKLQKEADKLQKQALREAYKPLQGGKNSLDHLQAHVPLIMMEAMGSDELEEAIAEESGSINIVRLDAAGDAANVIRWTRGRVTASLNSDEQSNKLSTVTEDVEEKDILIQISKMSLVAMIDFHKQIQAGNSPADRMSLSSMHHHWKTLYPGKTLHFFAYGMEAYFKNQLQNAIYGDARPARSKPTRKSILDIPYSITHDNMEEAFIDFACRCNQRIILINTPKEFARLFVTIHKAIADATFKHMKQQETVLFDAISANTKTNGVFVPDDSTEGYKELWIRQLEQFSLVSRDVAATIVNLYPSPRLLMEAYSKCNSEQDREQLVENVIIRRGTDRRIGPKMSRMLCAFMCSRDGEEILE